MSKCIYVVGLDDFNLRKLEAVGSRDDYEFRPLLDIDDVTARRGYSLDAVIDKAVAMVAAGTPDPDAIIGYWDFPVSLIAPMLCDRFGLVSPTLESVLKCEHKYWSRLEQQRAAPEHVPAFRAVDPFDDASIAALDLDYPFWLKPVKSFASHLGFRISNRADLDRAIGEIRAGIGEMGELFDDFLARVDLPEELAGVGGMHCIAEAMVSGRQCTLEGYVHRGEAMVYGIVDSVRHANRSTFRRYQYPSRLPPRVRARMQAIAAPVMERIGLDNAPFNMELFWDRDRDRIWLLEINPRISQSHGDVFEKVDGAPHHRVLVELALGQRPRWNNGAGPFRCAGKFFLRRFDDAVVTRVPSQAEIDALVAEIPGTLVEVQPRAGMRLSEMEAQDQDSYSYICALVFIGANSQRQLLQRYARAVQLLHFEYTEIDQP